VFYGFYHSIKADMTQKDLNNWIMYHEIHKLNRLGFSAAKIARHLVLDARTTIKYLRMNEQEYEQFLVQSTVRHKTLSAYEKFVSEKLSEFQDSSAAQIHDWLKEYHRDFPEVTPRTVYNFVMYVRHKHNIPVVPRYRAYFAVEDLPYGEQSQVDFGEYNMQLSNGKRKKVRFFAMILSRSRMKYIWFIDKPFTTDDVILAHEKAFRFFDGTPRTIVYDQDRTMIVDENIGQIILTSTFQRYTKSRHFKLHFCRKADPESKGKIENVIQYVKKNFLYNRIYHDLETLNQQALAWLDRTANHLEHNYTKIAPKNEFMIEKQHLSLYTPLTIEHSQNKAYLVRKTNTIAYKSNFYSLPSDTYQGSQTYVIVKEADGEISIFNAKHKLICTHVLSIQKGQTIINTNHRRDTSLSLDNMIQRVTAYFDNKQGALSYLEEIRAKFPRYTRDHIQVMLKTLANSKPETANQALEYCLENNIINANDWVDVYHVVDRQIQKSDTQMHIPLLDKANIDKACQMPQKSDIQTYEQIVNQ
jgi:transposase